MSEPFKNLINAQSVQRLAERLALLWPAFDRQRFTALANTGLEHLEMKARALQLCSALEATLPQDFDTAAALLQASVEGDEALDGWVLWPVGEFIARRGLPQPERALQVLHALTQRFTAEFAIRPFVQAHPVLVFDTLARWAQHPSEHVRRLVSEGSRPRLPWGLRLQALVQDPTPTLPLLAALQDDPSEYVRRSVANHLNDIAKDHPQVVAAWLEQHLPDASPQRRALLRHASRTLVKQGHPRVLAAWGLGAPLRGSASLQVTPEHIVLGDSVQLKVELHSRSAKPQTLVVDYAVHHVKASGGTSPKVFKGWNLQLPARGSVVLTKRHAVRPITTRRYHAGKHVVELQINGMVVASAHFVLALG
jgi:3-methyladenine DNA glycosylase AlkC